MKKMLFKIVLFFLILFVGFDVNALTHSPYNNSETGYDVIIEDDAELLTEDEMAILYEEMIPLTQYGNIIFKSINYNDSTTSYYASNYYHEKYGTESGTILLIDMDNRIIYIFSDGNNYKYITNSKATIITDNIYTYASDEDYYECASIAFEQILTTLEGGKIAEPMRYISNALISITCAFFVCFIFVLVNTNIQKASKEDILKNCNIAFNMSDVNASKTGQRRVYSPQDSGGSSGGGGGSSGGGGGGSSGGGGGHSFENKKVIT